MTWKIRRRWREEWKIEEENMQIQKKQPHGGEVILIDELIGKVQH
jgi:hypothetical protein